MASAKPLVLFSHGKEGTPNGNKIVQLMAVATSFGCHNISVDYRNIASPDKRADKLLDRLKDHPPPLVLVGSSMGAYISIVASKLLNPKGLFLLAPALYLPGYNNQDPTPHANITTIIHGWNDEVVPVANVMRFSQKHKNRVHFLDADHRLLTAMPIIKSMFTLFLDEILTSFIKEESKFVDKKDNNYG
ncbi:MAG: alpha/beta hydrolase [Magnetococcales bacterium]|nr:alpha/beta hydrolase [Magnetococcales bacterium]